MSDDFIAISEIFGPTIQGEGALIGMPTIFVRTGGCDYRCSWCDTGYAVLPDYQDQWQAITSNEILKTINQLTGNQPMWVTLSGGNPALQPLERLIQEGQNQGYQFSMETQGSIAQPWFVLLDQLTLSPKPPSSNMKFKPKGLQRCIEACQKQVDISLKWVVSDQKDLHWAKQVAEQYPEIPCFIQPCNKYASINTNTAEKQLSKMLSAQACHQQDMQWLIKAANNLGWHNVRILPQLHVWIWGDRQGV